MKPRITRDLLVEALAASVNEDGNPDPEKTAEFILNEIEQQERAIERKRALELLTKARERGRVVTPVDPPSTIINALKRSQEEHKRKLATSLEANMKNISKAAAGIATAYFTGRWDAAIPVIFQLVSDITGSAPSKE